jgi:hypothetical protein
VTRPSIRVTPRLPANITAEAPFVAVQEGRTWDVQYNPGLVSDAVTPPANPDVLVFKDGVNYRVPFTDVPGYSWTGLSDIPAAIDVIDGLTPVADRVAYYTGASAAALAPFTSFGRSVVAAADASAGRAALGVVIGTDVQAYDADLASLAAISGTDILAYRSAANTWSPVTIGSGIGFSGGTLSNTASASAPVGVISNLGLSASVAANALTITLTTAAGGTPAGGDAVSIPFRSPTAATGTITQRSVTAATTLVISSGSTLGTANTTPFRIWIVAFDDGGTIRLGAVNCLNSSRNLFALRQFGVASSTAEGGAGAADSAHVFYTGTAVSSKAYTILGYMEWSSGLTTAGTWATSATHVAPFRPGNALPGDKIQSIILNNGSGSSTTSTSMVDVTGASVSITPTSSANVIDVFAEYTGVAAAGGAATNTTHGCQLLRGSTAITNEKTIGVVSGAGTNMQTQANGTHRHRDFPATTSATTYKLQHRASSISSNTTTQAVSFIAEEIFS